MRLQKKMLIVLGSAWLVFMGVSYLGAQHFLMKSFDKLERIKINENISRVHYAINQVFSILDAFTLDWAHWNDAYNYVAGTNTNFVADNIETQALANYHLGLLMYFNKKGQLLVGLALNPVNKKILPYPSGLEKYIYPSSMLVIHSDPERVTHGFASLPSGIMLISAAGVSANEAYKPINGTLITGRYLSDMEIKKLSEITNIQLSLANKNDISSSKILEKIYNKLIVSSDDCYIDLSDAHNAYAYIMLRDILNQPIGMVKLTLPRDIVKIGSGAIAYYLAVFIISGILFAALILYLTNIIMLKRLSYLNKSIQKITHQGDYSQRIEVLEDDELAVLAKQFNELMHSIEKADYKLKEKIKLLSESEQYLEKSNIQLSNEIKVREQAESVAAELHEKLLLAARTAGMADIMTGVLHNIGNILNSIATSVSYMREKITDSKSLKLSDITLLVNQHKNDLAEYISKDSKGSKIPDYLTILSSSWKDENRVILNELSLLEKNIGHIIAVISTQQSLSGIVSMVEQFDLIEIIEDAISINKSTADKYHIQIDRDYQFSGKVLLDKVKLLHIIVNLIKNAIESLSHSEAYSKMILVKIYKNGDDRLTIEVIDNGVGIAKENIEKLFSYGFTTKVDGHGFGLHASILLANEMGGKLSANSGGLNKGAAFILELPIN